MICVILKKKRIRYSDVKNWEDFNMTNKNINTEEISVEQLLGALTYEGEREIKSTHKFPPFIFKEFHVFRQSDETRKLILEEIRKIKLLHEDDAEMIGNLSLSCILYHLTDLPRELIVGSTLDRILQKPNRKLVELIMSVTEEMNETLGLDLINFNTYNTLGKIKELG